MKFTIYVQDFVPGGQGQKQMLMFRHGIEESDVPAKVALALGVADRIEIEKESDDG